MKAVITCGGSGTRLLPFTKEMPKEMAPIFWKQNGTIQVIRLTNLINGITGKNKKITILGLSFKEDSDDIENLFRLN